MRRALSADENAAKLRSFRHTAFRLELQPRYTAAAEIELAARFRAGKAKSPEESPGLRAWFEQVRRQVDEGKRIARVRIHDEPPTDYQQMERWADPWNLDAGEQISYLTRRQAHDIELLPAAGPHDWWLLDSTELILLSFDEHGRISTRELVTDPSAVVQAAAWRDLAIHYAQPSQAAHVVA